MYRSNNQKRIDHFANAADPAKCNQQMADDIVQINPSGFQTSGITHQCQYYDKYAPLVATSIWHTTAVKTLYQRLMKAFKPNYNQSFLLSSYYEQGMDSFEFVESEKNINDLITKYKRWQDMILHDDDEDEDEDEDDDD